MTEEEGGESNANVHHQSQPGDPDYISIEDHVRHQLAFNAAYEARPDIIAKRAADAEADKRIEAEKNAKRKRPRLVQTTEYPWLKSDWVEPPVRPFKRR